MKLIKTIPLFPFLLVLFFCLHGSVENYGYIDLSEVLMIGVVTLAVVSISIALVWLFTKDLLFASLICFFISLWYLFFGAIQDWLGSHSFLFFLQKFSVLLPLLFASTIVWIIFIKRKKTLCPRLMFYFNVLLLVYCLIDAAMVSYKYFTEKVATATANLDFDAARVRAKPSVYFLLFDEYPGYESLQKGFGYSNDSLYNYLQARGFRILPTFSNYDYTIFSMSSILNMQYVDPHYDPYSLTQRDFQLRTNEIRNARAVQWFKQIGYRFQNYSIFDIAGQHSVSDQNSFLPVHSRLLTDKILHNRIIRVFPGLFREGKFALPFLKQDYLYRHDIDNKFSERKVMESAAEADKSPKFCYAHFAMPHGPFYRDSLGRSNPDSLLEDNFTCTKDLFLSYVKYSNTVMRKMIDQIVQRDPNAIVISASDHGYHPFEAGRPDHPFNFNNICAVRLPDKNYLPMKDKWSMVNFFRYLFNCEFGQNIPYLPDSSIPLVEQ